MAKNRDLVNLGNNIKKYRLEKGYTQEMFAEKIDKTVNYLSLIENGHKGILLKTLFDIAHALDIAPSKLLEPCEKIEGKIKKSVSVQH